MPTAESANHGRPTLGLQRQALRSLNKDGLVDVGVGLGLSFAALYIWLSRRPGVNMAAWTALFPILVMFLLRGLRKRFVYPRIGYAVARKSGPGILLVAIMTLVLVAGVVVMAVYSRHGIRPPAALMPWLIRLFALAGAAVLALMGRRTGFARFYFYSGVVVVAALASAAFRDTDHALLLLLGLPGMCLLVIGAVCFFLFLRRHPKPKVLDANS